MESIPDGTAGGLLAGQDGGTKKKEKNETEAKRTRETGSYQGHESNDCQQRTNGVHCGLIPP